MQLAFDFAAPPPMAPPAPASRPSDRARTHRGRTNYHAGLAAEDAVARAYHRLGCRVIARRYRASAGEVDLVLRNGAEVVFVEVKKGRTHDGAIERVRPDQVHRIRAAATEFVEGEPRGQLTAMRLDVATVDAVGSVRLHPGILAHC